MPKTIAFSSTQADNTTRIQPAADWKQQLSQAISTPQQLLNYLGLDANTADCDMDSHGFAIRVPHAYAAKMQPGRADDPLLLQVMSQRHEGLEVDGFTPDPVGDLESSKAPGLLHKYHGRVLLITTAACAVHCRYCFRRHFPYSEQQAERDQWSGALDYISADDSISEVILSGGDPLVLSDGRLARLIEQLEKIPHLTRLRIHSRLPVVLPDRITPSLVQLLAQNRLNTSLVIHANHANEITTAEHQALHRLKQAGITLLNQTVLLKGINDRLEQQLELSEALYSAGVLPYYLHLLDPVRGAAHFETSEEDGKQLIRQLRRRLPGYLVPRLVREIAGEDSKTPADEL